MARGPRAWRARFITHRREARCHPGKIFDGAWAYPADAPEPDEASDCEWSTIEEIRAWIAAADLATDGEDAPYSSRRPRAVSFAQKSYSRIALGGMGVLFRDSLPPDPTVSLRCRAAGVLTCECAELVKILVSPGLQQSFAASDSR